MVLLALGPPSKDLAKPRREAKISGLASGGRKQGAGSSAAVGPLQRA